MWQARTKENIFENASKQSTASRSATKVTSRLVKRPLFRHASQLLNWYRGRIEGYLTYRASKGRNYGGEVVERTDQVYEKVLGRAQRKFEERGRPGVGKAKSWEEYITADDDRVHADRSIQYRLLE